MFAPAFVTFATAPVRDRCRRTIKQVLARATALRRANVRRAVDIATVGIGCQIDFVIEVRRGWHHEANQKRRRSPWIANRIRPGRCGQVHSS
jgi:hypothetical protein